MELKFKVGDKVNCIVKEDGFSEWQNATVIEVSDFRSFPYTCICDYYGESETGLFAENELELAE